jgi:dienelactone hydrolase
VRFSAPSNDTITLVTALRNNPIELRARITAALDVLKTQFSDIVDTDRLGALGYCFGGGTILELARTGYPGLKAISSFHGSPYGPLSRTIRNEINKDVIVQIHHASQDDTLPGRGDFDIVQTELRTYGLRNWQVTRYYDAPHGFALPGESSYDELAAKTSFEATVSMLDIALRTKPFKAGTASWRFP